MGRRSRRRPSVSLALWQWFTGEPQPGADPLELLDLELPAHGRLRPALAERARQAWQDHSAEALRRWITHSPGTRPPAWWWFTAPTHGFAHAGDAEDANELPVTLVESEASWLRRHKLLPAAEHRRLSDADFQPVPDHDCTGAGIVAERRRQERAAAGVVDLNARR